MAAESVRTGACVTSGAEKLAARAGKRRRADGSETPALRASGDANGKLLHDPTADSIASGQDVRQRRPDPPRPNCSFWRVARICSRSASSSASRMLPSGTVGTKPTKTARRGLQAWREQQAQIVASSPSDPCRSAGFLLQAPTAGNLACAEASRVPPAASERADAENTGFPLLSEMERRVR